MIFIFSKEA